MVVAASSHFFWYFSSLRSLRAWWNSSKDGERGGGLPVGRCEGGEGKTAHLPSSGVGLHHRGGALHRLVLSLLLQESPGTADSQKLKGVRLENENFHLQQTGKRLVFPALVYSSPLTELNHTSWLLKGLTAYRRYQAATTI